jgi:predicted MPP superfamily phosphohydrolase
MMTRRQFAIRTLRTGGLLAAGLGYCFYEASQIRIRRHTVTLPNLPKIFEGKTLAILTDFHHGPYVGIKFIRESVALANSLKPDIITLLGDFAHKGKDAPEQLPPCIEAMNQLQAPLGVYAVPGNHDMHNGGKLYQEVVRDSKFDDLTNKSIQVKHEGESLWIAGVDDLWWGTPDLSKALKEVPDKAAAVLLSHNPDYAEDRPDPRVGLMLSGHTHGGQAYLPGIGAIWTPSKYGQKYVRGLVNGPASQVYISRGLGEAVVPMRLN